MYSCKIKHKDMKYKDLKFSLQTYVMKFLCLRTLMNIAQNPAFDVL
jgi:hypothetical protein